MNILRVTTINLLFQYSLEYCIFDVINVEEMQSVNAIFIAGMFYCFEIMVCN